MCNKRVPKIVHYCWFGGGTYSEKVESCIRTWRIWLPDWEFKLWNEKNFDVNSCIYTKEAYKHKKWAFVSDYVRIWAIYNYGGIYLDTDVEILKPIDDFLNNAAFAFFSKDSKSVCTWFMGATREHSWMKMVLKYYEEQSFVRKDGTLDMTPNSCVGEIALREFGGICNGRTQTINNGLTIYSYSYVGGHDFSTGEIITKPYTHCIHWNEATWWSEEQRIEHKKLQKCRRIFGKELGEKIYRWKSYFENIIVIVKKYGIVALIKKIGNVSKKRIIGRTVHKGENGE